ncbi:MAG: thermonuclease family protein [Motiliproteus sp.]
MLCFSKALITSAFVVFNRVVFLNSIFFCTVVVSTLIFSTLVFSTRLHANDCQAPSKSQPIAIKRIVDGDTLHLKDGRKVRLIGINTPELGRDGQPDQPLAKQATATARRLIKGQNPLLLQIGTQPQDHYGRVLGHIFLADGRSLEAELLKQGLGFAISMPPNLALRDCLNQAERQARTANLGVWAEADYRPLHASTLDRRSGGFGRYQGEISRAGTHSKGRYLELNGEIFVQVQAGTATALDLFSSDDLLGRRVEIRGWLIARKRTKTQQRRGLLPFMLKINHTDSLMLCDPDC